MTGRISPYRLKNPFGSVMPREPDGWRLHSLPNGGQAMTFFHSLSAAGFAATAISYGPARMGFGLFVPEFKSTFAISAPMVGLVSSLGFAGFFIGLLVAQFLLPLFRPERTQSADTCRLGCRHDRPGRRGPRSRHRRSPQPGSFLPLQAPVSPGRPSMTPCTGRSEAWTGRPPCRRSARAQVSESSLQAP